MSASTIEQETGTEIVPAQEGKAMVKVGGKITGGLVPRTFDELYRVAHIFAASGMVPPQIKTAAQAFVAIEMGLEIGLPPMAAVQNIAVINGRPSVWGDAALGIVRASGLLTSFKEEPLVEKDEVVGYRCTASRVGGDEATHLFTLKMAKRAGLQGKSGPWQQYPERMLQMRARGFVLRDLFPDVLRGVYIREELDNDEPIDVTPAAPRQISGQLAALESKVEAIKAMEVPAGLPSPTEAPPAAIELDEEPQEAPQEAPQPSPEPPNRSKAQPSTQVAPPPAPSEIPLPETVRQANETYLLRSTMEIKSGRPGAWRQQYESFMDRGVRAYQAVGWDLPEVEWAADVCGLLEKFGVQSINDLPVMQRPDFRIALQSFVEQAEDNAKKLTKEAGPDVEEQA